MIRMGKLIQVTFRKIATIRETMDSDLERIRIAVKKIADIADRTVYKRRERLPNGELRDTRWDR